MKRLAYFFVPGIPQPGGSKKGFVNPKTNRVVIVDDAKRNKDWRAAVQAAAAEAYQDKPATGPILLNITYYLTRPKGHFGSGRNADKIKPSASAYPVVRPDTLKLTRSTEDALTGILWRDDSQVVSMALDKRYATRNGASIFVQELGKPERGA